ncbi:MAG: DUF4198 domain-containing protein [Gemmatimonadaceae bacterium]
MKRTLGITLALLLVVATALGAHDLFLKPAVFILAPNTASRALIVNGTFTRSENSITWDRVRDLSVVGPAGTTHPEANAWSDKGDTSVLRFTTGAAGTYVLGVSTRPRALRLEGKDFNAYLESDGVPDILAARRKSGEITKPARERYQKHIKAILQVGDRRSDTYGTTLGYPAELVPLENPYALVPGSTLRLRTLVDGRPVANQYVVSGGRTPSGSRIAGGAHRSDSSGVVRVPLRSAGQWYVKFIHMTKVAGDTAIDYESKWASLTFELRTGHR